MPEFIPGLKLSELFFKEIVKPIMKSQFPDLKYSAGLIDSGSEVLGFDTPESRDHHWGPRLMIFLSDKDYKNKSKIQKMLSKKLPYKFRGYSTNFRKSGDPNDDSLILQEIDYGSINHRVDIYTIKSFFENYISLDPSKGLRPLDWLTLSEQKLLTIRSGRLFQDDLGLNNIKKNLHYYPKDIWLYLLSCQWGRISQEEPFVGRCGDVGDELGSSIVVAGLVKDLMKLCFLMEKRYSPYNKWFGTAFSKLNCSKKLNPIFRKVLSATDWKTREKYLSLAYTKIAEIHNRLNIINSLPTKVSKFHNRPYLIIHADIFSREIKKKIKDKTIKNIKVGIGSPNQFSDSTDVLTDSQLMKKFKVLY